MNLFVHDLKFLSDAHAPVQPAPMPAKPERWHCEAELDTLKPGVRPLSSVDYKRCLAELQSVSPLQVTTFGSSAHIQSTIAWSQVQLTRRKGIADARDVEMAFRFDQWGSVYAVTQDDSTPLGLYVYDARGRIVATIGPAHAHQAASFCAKVPTEPRRRRSSSRKLSLDPHALPRRVGYGPHTHANSRVARVLETYADLQSQALSPSLPTRCTPIPRHELALLLQELIRSELPVDLVGGSAAFWQFTHTSLSAIEVHAEALTLHGTHCELGLRPKRIHKTWLVRTHHEGQFVYAVLVYDMRGHLDLAILLPETPIASSVDPWRKLVRNVSRAYCSQQQRE